MFLIKSKKQTWLLHNSPFALHVWENFSFRGKIH